MLASIQKINFTQQHHLKLKSIQSFNVRRLYLNTTLLYSSLYLSFLIVVYAPAALFVKRHQSQFICNNNNNNDIKE